MEANAATLVQFEGFNAHFESLMGCCATYKQAYEMTEALVEKAFGVRKYASWQSFYETRRQLLAKKREENTLLSKKLIRTKLQEK